MSNSGASDWIGHVLTGGRYVVTDKLGEGGMGLVYRARDRNLEQDVVIKVPRRQALEDPQFMQRFAIEIRALVKLSHPHVVKVIDADKHDGLPYAVMPYLAGGSLETRRAKNAQGAIVGSPAGTLHNWLPAIGSALDFIHSQGYIHRDVKPANILFDAHGNAFLSDFGVAKVVGASREAANASSLTGAGFVMGTPDYLAPEVILGQPFDHRVDQYALAATVFEILTGRPPFVGPTPTAVVVAHTTAPPPLVHELDPSIPQQLSLLLRSALDKSPEKRFANCTSFAIAICKLSGQHLPLPQVQTRVVTRGRTTPIIDGRGSCPVCQRVIVVAEKVRGNRAPCPSCKAVLAVSGDLQTITEVVAPVGGPGQTTALPTRGGQPTPSPARPQPTVYGVETPALPCPDPLMDLPMSPPVWPTQVPIWQRPLPRIMAGLVVVALAGSIGYLMLRQPRAVVAEKPTLGVRDVNDQNIPADVALSLQLGVDAAQPIDEPLRFEFAETPPLGMKLDAQSGQLTWPVSPQRSQGTYDVKVRVVAASDKFNSRPSSFFVHVQPPLNASAATPKQPDPSPASMPMPNTPKPKVNQRPTVSVEVANSTVPRVGRAWGLVVAARDPDGDPLIQEYTIVGRDDTVWIPFTGTQLSVVLPQEGQFTVAVRVRDAEFTSEVATVSTFVEKATATTRPSMLGDNANSGNYFLISNFEGSARAYYRLIHDEAEYNTAVLAVRRLVDEARKEPQVVQAMLEKFVEYYRPRVEAETTPAKRIAKVAGKAAAESEDNTYLRYDALEAYDVRGKPIVRDIKMRDDPDNGLDAIGQLYNQSLQLASDKLPPPAPFSFIARKELPYLRLICYVGPAAIPALKTALADSEKRPCALTCLSRLGTPAVTVLQAELSNRDPEIRAGALWALASILRRPTTATSTPLPADQQAQLTQSLVQALNDTDENVRLHALHVLAGWAPSQPGLVKQFTTQLTTLIEQAQGDKLRRVMTLLVQLGPDAAPAMPQILTAIRREKPALAPGIEALGNFGPEGLATLLTLVNDPALGKDVREKAVLVIATFKDQVPADTVVALGKLLKPGDTTLRKSILQTLRDLGPVAKPALADLKRVRGETNLSIAEIKFIDEALKLIEEK